MIKAIIFDMGGVVIDYKNFLEKFFTYAEKCTRFKKEALEEYFFTQVSHLEKNEKNLRNVWRLLLKDDNKSRELARLFLNTYEDNVQQNSQLIKLIQKLKNHYFIGCLSNLGKEQKKINKKKGFYKFFSEVIISSDYGVRKPQFKLFNKFFEKAKVKPEECVFVDDFKENIYAAQQVGMQVIHYLNITQLKKSLVNFGVNI